MTYSNSYGYDTASNRTSFTAPDNSTVIYGYDTLNRLTNLTDSATGQFTFGYDILSRRTSLNRPNGVNTSYSYDSLSRLLSVLHQAGTVTLDGASYGYDNAGNRTSKTNQLNNFTENYTYDPIYQLTQVTQGLTTTESYSYDAVGNRLSSQGMSPYAYNSSNELTSTPSATFTYDANGNTSTKTNASGTTQYSWDFNNRLSSVALPGSGRTVSFRYDPFGRRIQKSGASGTVNYLYDGETTVGEVDASGNLVAHYTQGAGIDEPLSALRSGAIAFYEADGLGSLTSLSSVTGAISNSYTYDTFGNGTLTGSFVNPYRYTGRDYDPETGLQYSRARYYHPQIGRFISEDPIQFRGGRNFYRYVRNNPVRRTDPTGRIHQAWGEPPFDGRLHDDAQGGLEVLRTKGRNIQLDIQWLQHSIEVRSIELQAFEEAGEADAGHIDRVNAKIATLERCQNECDKDKPDPETEPFKVPPGWLTWFEDRWNELKHWKPPQQQTPWGPLPFPLSGTRVSIVLKDGTPDFISEQRIS